MSPDYVTAVVNRRIDEQPCVHCSCYSAHFWWVLLGWCISALHNQVVVLFQEDASRCGDNTITLEKITNIWLVKINYLILVRKY